MAACSPGSSTGVPVDAAPDAPPPFVPAASCAPALSLATPPVRSSSLRQGNCDWGEIQPFVHSGCRRDCADDRRCAPAESCRLVEYPTDYIPPPHDWLCTCQDDTCPERGPGALPREPEGGLELWAREPSLPTDLHGHAAAASQRWLFVAGGFRLVQLRPNVLDRELVSTVFAGRLDAAGAVTGWSKAGALPTPLWEHGLAVHGERLYLVGGRERGDPIASAWSAAIAGDGTLGPWREEAPLPEPRAEHRTLVWGDWLIVAGGRAGPAETGTWTLWRAPFGPDGQLGEWSSRHAAISVYEEGGAGIALDRLYILGREGFVHSAPLPELSEWRQETRWPIPRQFGPPDPILDTNMGPVHLWELCGALVALVRGGNALTAPLDVNGRMGLWRIASRFYGPETMYASAASADILYAVAGSNGVTPEVPIDTVWSVRRQR
jgi:hypothetical protein